MEQYKKTPTHRLFAAELAATTIRSQVGNRDDYVPNIFLTPTGANVNRVMLVGAAVEMDDIGKDAPFYRVRIADPTGAVFAYAGQYQPEAQNAISRLNVPCFVAVVGKVSHYTPESGGDTVVSLKVETIGTITAQQRDLQLSDAAHHTVRRLTEAVKDQKLLELYPGFDYKEFAQSIDHLLDHIIEGFQESPEKKPEPPKETRKKEEPKATKKNEKKLKQGSLKDEETPSNLSDSETLLLETIKTHGKDKPLTKETLKNVLVALGYSMLNVDAILESLKMKGYIIEPTNNSYKAV